VVGGDGAANVVGLGTGVERAAVEPQALDNEEAT